MTHYEALGVEPTATFNEIETAYNDILHDDIFLYDIFEANHPDETQGPRMFAQSRIREAQKRIRAAIVAWKVLSNVFSRKAYDESLASPSSSNDAGSPQQKVDSDGTNYKQEAEYRTLTTSNATMMDIKIGEWRLNLTISSKFRFTNNVTEISDPENASSISFEVVLEHDKSSPEYHNPTLNELTVNVQHIPGSLHVATVQTLFREMTSTTATLVLTITADESGHTTMPWEFGFDFDMNAQPGLHNRARATCMILSVKEPPEHVKTRRSIDTPEQALYWDKKLKADAWCDL